MNPDVAQFEALGKELLRRCLAEEEPADLHAWATQALAHIGGTTDASAVLRWKDSFTYYEELLRQRAAMALLPPDQRRQIDWPWASWNRLISPMKPGMLASISAPDGEGKTIVVECLAEHWAARGHRVAFVHYELNRELMMDRRTARHTSIVVRMLESGMLTPEQEAIIQAVRPRLEAWEGEINYVHTPGWTMEQTVAELRRLREEGLCDVVVIDYLEKAFASARQLKMYGANYWLREADNVEMLKSFAESAKLPVIMVTQLNKAGKTIEAAKMDRSDIGGSGEKSTKANLVVLLKRETNADGSRSNVVRVRIDKNTMGADGAFVQYMQPEFFRLADIHEAGNNNNGRSHTAN